MGIFPKWTIFGAALLALLVSGLPARAQLVGSDTAPGDSCVGFPTGATRLVSDPDGDASRVTLICDGSNWFQESLVVLSKTGAAPNAPASVVAGGSNGNIQFNSGGSAFGGEAALNWDAANDTLVVTGDIEYTGTITDTSDRRLKYNISKLDKSLAGILALNGYSFTMSEHENADIEYGLIAQEVEPVFPELVVTKENGFKTMNYLGMIAPLVESIKAQQAMIDTQQAEIDALRDEISTLQENK